MTAMDAEKCIRGPTTSAMQHSSRPAYTIAANECRLDNTCAVNVPQPKSKEEENDLIRKFISGLEKLFQKENNWTFLQPLSLTMEHCAKCQACSDACHI